MKHLQMKHLLLGSMAAFCFAIISCGGPAENENSAEADTSTMPMDAPAAAATHAEATITGTKTDTTVDGKITFDTDNGKVKMALNLTVPKLANKSVAVHIHEHPDCGDNGNASHGHWNPTHSPHGKWGSDSFHLGDIGNVKLDAEGKGTLEMSTDLWTLGTDSSSVLNRAIIVHSGVDDYKTQPTGNAGSRIGCSVIK
ncbi:superoxide dismutase family protein [Foetidibacter luteolus]|uniref:superoxide dismutase family protein n=1 Tax=Foetidibacter luteolus TaxID=2608880 RepID=UPI00129B5C9D|nr:superoxide dismutase family protein [Foetidibacter luteolus]